MEAGMRYKAVFGAMKGTFQKKARYFIVFTTFLSVSTIPLFSAGIYTPHDTEPFCRITFRAHIFIFRWGRRSKSAGERFQAIERNWNSAMSRWNWNIKTALLWSSLPKNIVCLYMLSAKSYIRSNKRGCEKIRKLFFHSSFLCVPDTVYSTKWFDIIP